ncbi:GDCCVxC domain-containing (seleno)protein [uncultured Neptuniibacter sp.]|uniref:GDCCVxC domain-containing (seleno)protein n=1 Tax=uncultured Neptuniibacter sp. TaxID=502143 RepID=UPI00262A8204|nr:GDCCVxC domain-containing (seleno)protein [uncultured Neptuniibacter sp.]
MIVYESLLTCPECGFQHKEIMPDNYCQWFYECVQCHKVLKPLSGDCCVFCSYGSVNCPPVQANGTCCTD